MSSHDITARQTGRGRPVSRLAALLSVSAAAVGASVLGLAWSLGGGAGLLYVACYIVATLPGLPVGFALFGRQHAAGWIAGALIGYGFTALALWIPVQLGAATPVGIVLSWTAVAALAWLLTRGGAALIPLPRWTRLDSVALLVVLLVVPALLWRPFGNIGAPDAEGGRRYRAYFTADFLWHMALTAELARLDSPPRNPYLVRRPLNYYWLYFVPPAVASRAGLPLSIQTALAINALCAGLLFVAAIFVCAWCAVPRAAPAAAATIVAVVAASAEGWYALWRLWHNGQPLESLRHLNIDAMTFWFMQGITVDGLPRSLWYTPQHATACALSAMAAVVPLYARPRRPAAGLLAGLALGLAVTCSPFLGGAFSLIYGITALWTASLDDRPRDHILTTAPAALPVIGALAWCVASGTFEGAGGAIAIGVSRMIAAAPFAAPALALGPLLGLAIPAFVLRPAGNRPYAAITGAVVGLALLYFVTLTTEPVWIGWRAGQILLVMLPGLAAATIALMVDRGARAAAVVLTAGAVVAGLPTTAIDAYNAQDVRNTAMGPGFRWTVVVSADASAVLAWIRRNTAGDSVVQMSISPRGRETWTLIPSFAERRMAAGMPISLLRLPEYEQLSAQVDRIYASTDAAEAAELARRLRIDYLYLDAVERGAFGEAAAAKFTDARYFAELFRQGPAAVYAVR